MPRWRKLQLVEIGRAFGTRVSDLLEMEEAGYGPESRLAVDDDYLAFAQHFERMLDATKLVDAPERKKDEKPQVPVPYYTEDQLLAELDLASGERPSDVVAARLDDREWDRAWDDVNAERD